MRLTTALLVATFVSTSPIYAQSAAALIDEIIELQGQFRDCLQAQTVALGRNNTESAETVIRAANAQCAAQEAELRAAYAESPMGRAHTEGLVERDRRAGENAGVAELLKIRAHR